MSNKVKELFEQLELAQEAASIRVNGIKDSIKEALTLLWDSDKRWDREFSNAQNTSLYMLKEDGVYSWYRVNLLSDIPKDQREFFTDYALERGFHVDWDNDCLENYQGDDSYMIQKEHGRDNGLYQGRKLLFTADQMRVNGEWSDEKIGHLIEEHMTRSGYFPGAFEVSYHGDIEVFNAQEHAKKYQPESEEANNE